MKYLHPPGWPRPKGYSNGVSARGRMIFTAGVIGWNEQEIVTSHLFEVQFGQALRNVATILAEDGAEPRHIVRLTIYVTDRDQYRARRDELAGVWKSVMGDHYPAIALVEVKGLVNSSAVVEIEATAVVED